MGLEIVLAAAAVAVPLWKLALAMGVANGEMRQILAGVCKMVEDHEQRLRGLEIPPTTRR
jgi:hypothetical protein